MEHGTQGKKQRIQTSLRGAKRRGNPEFYRTLVQNSHLDSPSAT
jgi:hypothetical protein